MIAAAPAEPDGTKRWDVLVVGAGPAGSSAARAAALAGARVLLVDAARFPRYKTCGGGLIGASLAELPAEAAAAVVRRIDTVTVARKGGRARAIRSTRPFLALTDRDRFDQALVDAAVAAGAVFRDGVRVRRLEEIEGGVAVHTTDGVVVSASVVVGADGSAGVVGRFVGVRIGRSDLGLELELELELAGMEPGWAGRVHLDWGAAPGTYGWVFPKADRLTVGVMERKGDGGATRRYLDRFVHELGLGGLPVERSSGHLTRWREPGSPVRRGRVLVAGDAAGLLEPWTREGISFALRSGRAAGEAAAAGARNGVARLEQYAQMVRVELEPEQRGGALLLRLFERHPLLVHLALTRTGRGADAFVRVCRGGLSIPDGLRRHPLLRRLAVVLAGDDRARS
ncbi:geranylgeranyl reductase family protein [Amnibacterium sp. CER49]|uniref:geranylgeranyl reductase family protein n=1 Tax=Amnibacterium sp. CER49 TaxID=3039161 RepID=UPI00244C502C|nr:geranylgeranyl reductase family protein [Amnibacterium sp. CER49]MDH2442424.1 geranylgeranyl reductase family protein [Amnibacterium sp. CER49]